MRVYLFILQRKAVDNSVDKSVDNSAILRREGTKVINRFINRFFRVLIIIFGSLFCVIMAYKACVNLGL